MRELSSMVPHPSSRLLLSPTPLSSLFPLFYLCWYSPSQVHIAKEYVALITESTYVWEDLLCQDLTLTPHIQERRRHEDAHRACTPLSRNGLLLK